MPLGQLIPDMRINVKSLEFSDRSGQHRKLDFYLVEYNIQGCKYEM
jgi:hypothetical protein